MANTNNTQLSEIHHHEIEKFLDALNREQLLSLGAALGLSYTKLRRKEKHLIGDLISGWLNMEDNVEEVSGIPCWANLIKVLEDKGHRGIASRIKDSKVSSCQGGSDIADKEMALSAASPHKRKAFHDTDNLNLEHIPFLVEYLSEGADIWRDIGSALKFEKQNLDEIEANKGESACSVYLQRLVEEWLEGKYPHTVSPTLANLLKALKSHTVDWQEMAERMRKSLPQVISNISDLNIVTLNQNHILAVTEDMPVMFRASVDSKLRPSSDFTWREMGKHHIIVCDFNREKPTLCIFKADIDLDGNEYSYGSKLQQTESDVPSVALNVSCPQLDQFKESLASTYLAQPEVPQDLWPPVSSKAHIKLALVKQEAAIDYNKEFMRLTIRGDMDDILNEKEIINYENVFDGVKSGSLLLIEGRPGSGKTTFVHKITRDWAASEVQGPMRLVLLISLRVLNSLEKPLTLADILQLFDLQESEKIIKKRKGKGICFVFDGLDEFSPNDKENSIVHKIINKLHLPQSIVIVASRPAALVKVRHRADRQIEVIGFPRDQIFNYMNSYYCHDSSKASELNYYLLSHLNILHMCYLPIHAAMVAFLFDVTGEVPRTETEIYKLFTHFTLMRSLSKHEGQDELEDLVNTDKLLKGEERKLFDIICEHAFEITKLNKQVLDQSKKIKQLLQNKDIRGISLGLVTVDRTAGLYGFENFYTFLHLTHQEYLAAHHISTLSDKDQYKLIEQHRDTDHMQVVWRFYCGLVNFEKYEYKIKGLINSGDFWPLRNKTLHFIQCAYESQQSEVCKSFLEDMGCMCISKDSHNKDVLIEQRYLTTTDFTALGYFLANGEELVKLSLRNCTFNVEGVEAMLKENPCSLCTLVINHSHSDCDLIESTIKLIAHKCSLKCLEISLPRPTEKRIYPSLDSEDLLGTSLLERRVEESFLVKNPYPYLDSDLIRTSFTVMEKIELHNVSCKPEALSNLLHFCKQLKSLKIISECTMVYLTDVKGFAKKFIVNTGELNDYEATADFIFSSHLSTSTSSNLLLYGVRGSCQLQSLTLQIFKPSLSEVSHRSLL